MKTLGVCFLGSLLLVFSGFHPDDRKDKKLEKEKEMSQLIESGHFRFVARSAESSLGNFDNLGNDYDLIIDSLKIEAYLPYYGRAYSVLYGSEGGVKFDLTADKIDKQWNKKKKIFTISAEVKDPQDSYTLYLTTSLSGYANLSISFSNRQLISYYGNIEKI